jgi:hypothetical protein
LLKILMLFVIFLLPPRPGMPGPCENAPGIGPDLYRWS